MKIRKILAVMAISCCLISALSTILYFQHSHSSATENARRTIDRNLEMIASSLEGYIHNHQKSVAMMAGLPAIQQIVSDSSASSRDESIDILNRACNSLAASLCYILDQNGNTILDNTNTSAATLVGRNYAFRPYFTLARDYGHGVYMAVGVTTRKRGIYLSHQIRSPQGDSSGVLVIKLQPDILEQGFQADNNGHALLIDPNGVIFASTQPDWTLQTLWDVPEPTLQKLVNSRQFGEQPLSSLGFTEKDENTVTGPEEQAYMRSSLPINFLDNWQLVYLVEKANIPFGIFSDSRAMITFSMVIILTGFAVIVLYRIGNADINRRRLAEQALQQSEARLQQLITLSNEAILIHHEGKLLDANEVALRMFGFSHCDELRQHVIWELVASESVGEVRQYSAEDHELPYQITAQTITGEQFPVEVSTKSSYLQGKAISVCCIQDITERLEQQEHMLYQAYHDSLTGLPNRNLMQERLENAIERAHAHHRQTAIMFIDLDGFKKINDTVGHTQGDQLLVAATQRLQGVMREGDTLARLGGDEFIIIIEEFANMTEVETTASRVLEVLSREFVLESQQYLFISGSVGIAVYPDDAKCIDNLMQCADTAMYCSKELGRNRYQFFTEQMRDDVRSQISIEQQLHSALANQEFEILYQPICATTDKHLVAVEALLRWHNPELGHISPDRFIPIAEQSGLIVAIGEWVVRQVAQQTARWRNMGMTDLVASINISPRQFSDPGLLPLLQQVLAETQLPPQSLCIEVTEGLVLKDDEQTNLTFARMKNLGVNIALDDFGTGYSALGYLKKFPFSHLKIDRSFVYDLGTDSSDRKLIEATVAMAKGLGLTVVAEGVETEGQMRVLEQTGCHSVQGYYISRPLTVEAFNATIATVPNQRVSNNVVNFSPL